MKANEVESGDVYTGPSGNWMVRKTREQDDGLIVFLLSAGRTDPGDWGLPLKPDTELDIFRPKK